MGQASPRNDDDIAVHKKESLCLQLNECLIISCRVFKFARVIVFLKMTESTTLKLIQKLIKAYAEAHKEKNWKNVQLGMSAGWKDVKKLKDWDLEVAVGKKTSELEKLSMK